MSLFSIFKDKLSKTSNILSFNILEILKNKKIDDLTLEELENVLISSDISLDVVNQLIDSIKKIKISNDDGIKNVLEILAQNIESILLPREHVLINKKDDEKKILIFVGVNGSGKTTTIGKIANKILSNNTNLINQLIKLKNVISKVNSTIKVETVLVLDGTNGSNMIKQVEIFGNELNVSSLIITKLDGTAKGGALISIANKFEIPISYVGLGESIEDLVTFNSQNFARSILNLEEQK